MVSAESLWSEKKEYLHLPFCMYVFRRYLLKKCVIPLPPCHLLFLVPPVLWMNGERYSCRPLFTKLQLYLKSNVKSCALKIALMQLKFNKVRAAHLIIFWHFINIKQWFISLFSEEDNCKHYYCLERVTVGSPHSFCCYEATFS